MILYHYAKCHHGDSHCTECRVLCIIMLNVIILSVVVPLKNLGTEKHASLLCGSFEDEEIKKNVRLNETCGQCYKTFYGCKLQLFIIS